MDNDDSVRAEAAATGILQCLRMLAEEAASLRLARTVVALQEAIEACESEQTETGFEASLMEAFGRVIH